MNILYLLKRPNTKYLLKRLTSKRKIKRLRLSETGHPCSTKQKDMEGTVLPRLPPFPQGVGRKILHSERVVPGVDVTTTLSGTRKTD